MPDGVVDEGMAGGAEGVVWALSDMAYSSFFKMPAAAAQ